MADPVFVVSLGADIYLDSNGEILYSPAPPPGAVVYHMPHNLHFDGPTLGEAVEKFGHLKDKEHAHSTEYIGLGLELLHAFVEMRSAGAVAAAAVTAAAAALMAATVGTGGAAAVLAVVAAMVSLATKANGMSPQLRQQLEAIRDEQHAEAEIRSLQEVINLYDAFAGKLKVMHSKLIHINVHSPGPATLLDLHKQLMDLVDELQTPLSHLENAPWLTAYIRDEYKGRFHLSGYLYATDSNGIMTLVPPTPGNKRLDYRPAVAMFIYGTAAYLTLLRAAMPWSRSAGVQASTLRQLADKIDIFVLKMQHECLARTHYTASSVISARLRPPEAQPHAGPYFYGIGLDKDFPVGAFDLVRYNDRFLNAQFFTNHNTDPGKREFFDYTWRPAQPGHMPYEQIAALANKKAQHDYSELQVLTGVCELVKTARLLRFMATPPLHSETVTGRVIDSRTFVSESPTTARSPDIPLADVIEMPAKRKTFNARSRASVTTQLPGFQPEFRYRVVLRTLASRIGKDGWGGRDYNGWAWQGKYEQHNANVQLLKPQFNRNLILSEHELFAGTSPAQPLILPNNRTHGTIRLRASTFDWYVPVNISDLPFIPAEHGFAERVFEQVLPPPPPKIPGLQESPYGHGAVSIHLASKYAKPKLQTLDHQSSPILGQADDLWGEHLAAPDTLPLEYAERRQVREETVDLDWSLTWEQGRLNVQLSGRPDQRPFQVFVVIEERVYNGEDMGTESLLTNRVSTTIHTAFAADIVNQIVLVPQAFFLREAWALQEAEEHWKEILGATLEETAPHDPTGLRRALVHMLDGLKDREERAPTTATMAETLQERFEFIARERPVLWEAALVHRAQSRPFRAGPAAQQTAKTVEVSL